MPIACTHCTQQTTMVWMILSSQVPSRLYDIDTLLIAPSFMYSLTDEVNNTYMNHRSTVCSYSSCTVSCTQSTVGCMYADSGLTQPGLLSPTSCLQLVRGCESRSSRTVNCPTLQISAPPPPPLLINLHSFGHPTSGRYVCRSCQTMCLSALHKGGISCT